MRQIVGVTQNITERKQAEEALKATSEQLRALSAGPHSAREEEGARIARARHDELGPALTSFKWDIEEIEKLYSGAGDQTGSSRLREKLNGMTKQIDATINTVRRISSELRPRILDDLGLVAAIEWQAQQFEARSGITCHFDSLVDNVDLNREQATAIFRAILIFIHAYGFYHSPMGRSRSSNTNRLLTALPSGEYNRLAPHLEPVSLNLKQDLYQLDELIKQVYFPADAVISIVPHMKDGRTVEVGMVGNEGVVDVHALSNGSSTPYRYIALTKGHAYRMKTSVLKPEFKRGGALQELLLRHTQARLIQFSQIGACNCLHTIIERVCRWLLMVQDRARPNEHSLTQQTISQLLLTRRTGITESLGILQKKGLISYRYGKIMILDRRSLERETCECYGIIRDGFNHLRKQ
jgi:CRP-like cAMP-binding protein